MRNGRKSWLYRAAGLAAAVALIAGCEDDEVLGAGAGGAGGAGGSSAGAAGTSGSGGSTGGVTIPGQTSAVTATYDESGFLHIAGKTDEDVYAALGYFHAQNRFFFMDFIRHLVRGQLGAIVKVGDLVLQQDYNNRLFFSTPQGEPLEDKLYGDSDASTKTALDAYARGVNAWLADVQAKRNGATLTTEYDFAALSKDPPRAWEPQDSAAVGLYVMRDLSETSSGEIYLTDFVSKLDAKFASDLLPLKPLYEVSTLTAAGEPAVGAPTGGGSSPLVGPTLFDASAKKRAESLGPMLGKALSPQDWQRLADHQARGSNNWVLSPARAKNGKGLLANDPHLTLGNPSIWFPVEIDGKTGGTGKTHAAGGSFPGMPLVMTGHNEEIAWGVTTVYYDLTDVYQETLTADGKSVMFNGKPVAILEKQFTFEDSSTKKPITKTFQYVPHHGPIVSVSADGKTALSVRWVAQGGTSDLQGFLQLNRAGSTTDAREALKAITSANQNFVVVDRKGDIGWFPYGKLPKRPWASASRPPWLVLPGDGTAEWDGFVDVADLPQAFNPPKNFIATANQEMSGASFDGDPTNDGQQAFQSWEKAEGTREQRIVDLIEAGGNDHTIETLSAIQGDTHVLLAELVVPSLLAAGKDSTDAGVKAVTEALTGWKYTCPTGLATSSPDSDKSTDADAARESIGCTAFHMALYAVGKAALDDEMATSKASLGSGDRAVFIARALGKPEQLQSTVNFWDNTATTDKVETRDDILRAGMASAATQLAVLGSSSDDWRWGRVHTLTLRSIFDNFGLTTYNAGPWAEPGGFLTVNVGNPSDPSKVTNGKPDLGPSSGPSLRTLIEITDQGPRMSFQYPGGADLHRESPFYNNLVENWLVNKPVAFPFGAGAVTKPTSQVTVSPGQ